MTNLEYTFALFIVAYFAGLIGALTGLGGGVIIVPVLVILLKIDLKYAMGASLIAVIATSSGAALTFIRHHYTNLRIGMFLETGAILGAIVGAVLVKYLPTSIISIIFGLVLLLSIWTSLKRHETNSAKPSHPWAKTLSLEGKYLSHTGLKSYSVFRVPIGFSLMTIAGALSGLLGIGSGALKVLALEQAMGLPYKVATSTSNFMIGMTAAASAGIYFSSGYIYPEIAFPVLIGVLIGSFTGSKILIKAKPENLKILFSIIILFLALQMIYKGLIGL